MSLTPKDAINSLVGMKLRGYCNGFFNKDFGDKVVIANGENWIVALDEYTNRPVFAEFHTTNDMVEYALEWARDDDYEFFYSDDDDSYEDHNF